MSKLEIKQLVLGSVSTNCYFLKNTGTKEMIIVDPADQSSRIIEKVREMEGKPQAILLTHAHYDHMYAVDDVRKEYGLKVYACKEEKNFLCDARKNLSEYNDRPVTVKADIFLDDLEVFEAAGFRVQLIHTPGHTPGSSCYYIGEEKVLFSGDTLFCGSVGRTDFPGGSMSQIVDSLHRLLDSLPEDTEVFPGHGEATTIGDEKRYNPFV